MMSRRCNCSQISQLDLLCLVTGQRVDASRKGASLSLCLLVLHLAAIIRIVLACQVQIIVIRNCTVDPTVFFSGTNLGEITRCQPTDDLFSVLIKEVTLCCPCNRALHVGVFSRGNSDTRHRSKDGVFFDGLANGALELVEMHAACLLHDFAHPCLALL